MRSIRRFVLRQDAAANRRLAVVTALVAAVAALVGMVPSARAGTVGVWITPAEIQRLPTSGAAWENVRRVASGSLPRPHVSDPTSQHDTSTLAVAYVAARTGDSSYRNKAAGAIMSAIGTEDDSSAAGSQHLPICRNATAYVIAADVIDLRGYSVALDDRFRSWIKELRDRPYDQGVPTRLIYESRASNHGTMCGAARAAISRYLGDQADLARTAQVLKGWLGDRQSHQFSDYHRGSETYMPDPSQPRPVNPAGSVVQGHNVDGMLPTEHARCGAFSWPPCYTSYPWGGLAGAVVNAEILRRAGYSDVFQWESQAFRRAYARLYELSKMDPIWWHEASNGDDNWQPWLVNHVYGTSFPLASPTRQGRNMAWTDWTHGTRSGSPPPAANPPPPENPPPEESPPEESTPEESPPEESPPEESPPEESPPEESPPEGPLPPLPLPLPI